MLNDVPSVYMADCSVNGVDSAAVAKLTGSFISMRSLHYSKFIRSGIEDKLAAIQMV